MRELVGQQVVDVGLGVHDLGMARRWLEVEELRVLRDTIGLVKGVLVANAVREGLQTLGHTRLCRCAATLQTCRSAISHPSP